MAPTSQLLRIAEFMSHCTLWFRVLLLLATKEFCWSKLHLGNLTASPSTIGDEGVLLVETASWKFAMSMWDLASDDEGRNAAHKNAETPDDMAIRGPQAYSTMIEADVKESGYGTGANGAIDSAMEEEPRVSEKNWNGTESLEMDRTVIEKRQPKLTEKGKSYRLAGKKKERNKLKTEIQSRIANIGTLMGLDKNLELVREKTLKLNECFKLFGDLHEEVQELLTEEEQIPDSQVYDNMHNEIKLLRETVQKWMIEAGQRISAERKSTKSSARTKGSRSSRASTTSSRARALQAKARQAELGVRIAQLDNVEAARKEAEKVRLKAEFAAAAAISKVYEDAIKEDDEQYLGSDDPDNDDPAFHWPEENGQSHELNPQRTFVKEKQNSSPRTNIDVELEHSPNGELKPHLDSAENQLKDSLNPEAPKFTPQVTRNHESSAVHTSGERATQDIVEGRPNTAASANRESQVSFWEKMELRMTQPPPAPTPFDGDPARYLRFRANFRDQVETRASLTDSEKMNYLMSYTIGKAREVIGNYQGLPNGCQLALEVLKQRFGQNAMIVEALKSSVVNGPRIRSGDNVALLALSDKLQNCCSAMIELQSNELDCTTNLRQIFDRLPDHLQAKWRKSVKLYREKMCGKEPTLKELSLFISGESQTENDPVYGRSSYPTTRVNNGNRSKKPPFTPKAADGTPITTMTTDVQAEDTTIKQGTGGILSARGDQNVKGGRSQGETCKVCKANHGILKCPVFPTKSLSWRRQFTRSNALCYRCLSARHIRRRCPEKKGCTEKDCAHPLSHHSLLHVPGITLPEGNDIAERNVDQNAPARTDLTVNNATMEDSKRSFVLLKVVPLSVVAENGTVVNTYGLLDTAAVSSLITSHLVEKLQLQGIPEKVSINTVTHKNHDCELVKVKFLVHPTGQDGPCFPVCHALAVESLNVSARYCPNQLDLSEWPHLKDLEVPNALVDINEVSVLIGQDVPQAHIVLDYCWGDNPQSQPYGMKTPFGWCVAGPTSKKEDDSQPVALSVFEFDWAKDESPMKLHQQVEKFWASESYGFGNAGDSANSVEDNRALEILEGTTKLKNGMYEVGLLWRNQDCLLPNNRSLAEKRLKQLKKRFERDPDFAEQYKATMNDYVAKGYAVKLPKEEAASTGKHTWYLPHHGVINPNKAKVRVVYDAAAEFGGTSLNKELLQGPQLNNSLIGVLFRFRKDEVAVASDIESMFHRVACTEEDADALRFLWWSESMEEPPSDHKMTVHLFGKADSPCIAAWALQRTATDNRADFSKEVCDIVSNNFYVDDCLFSVPTTERAVKSSLQLIELLKKGNFRLTKFVSNVKEVLAAIPAEERTIKNLDLDKLPIERALGLQWDTETDTFGVKVSLSQKQLNDDTSRGCLSTISSTFDPLGMIGPVMLPAKRVMQKTWKLKLHWDEKLPEDLLNGWKKWKDELVLLSHVNIPRCYFDGGCPDNASFQLHHFSDASEYGYGTVSYLRKKGQDGTIKCSFVMSKSRTAPLQYVSVPRLELQAATIAVRVHDMILKEIDLNISSTFFWTDSKITLQYINNESRRFKTYVANRVSEIREVSHPSQWRHCPGTLNPADDASRGLSARQLLSSERWFNGPAFLAEPESEWPQTEIGELTEDEMEIKNEKPIFTSTTSGKLHELLVKYSSWTVLQRKVAWLLKFKAYLQCRKGGAANSIAKYLTTEELERATTTIVKLVQSEAYEEEIGDLKKRGNVKGSSGIVKLRPVLVNGVLRVGGRIPEAPIALEAKFPMIVPPKHHVTQLLIQAYHHKLAHAGQDHILAQLREQFWIPKGRSAVRKVVRSCLTCKKQRAARMEQMMAALPAFRTTAYEPCFTHTGVDFFGPLNVKRGRSVVKRWGALFTCLNSRAVHLELATSLESDCFINVLRRFISRRGPPKCIYSDNGTNFVGAEREIREAIDDWNQKQIQDELLQKGCQWKFQPPKASHASGVWERLIRSTRTALKATLGKSLVDEEVLATAFTEVESILNSRPLCAASDDPNDCEPLTPNHLLLQRAVYTLPPGSFVKEDVFARKKWRQVQILADHFWKRWLKEYIPALQERQKWQRPRRNAEVGDLVLLVDESLPRGQWRMGRVIKAVCGRDGLVRTVEVKTGALTSLVRPVQKLCLLEESGNLCRD